jgi:alanyl-tRNA synthetase
MLVVDKYNPLVLKQLVLKQIEMTSTEIRNKFLQFFKEKGHQIVPSAPIVLKDDPTLLFTNAGMNQFKDYFLANKQPPYKRVVDTQKCLRVSGKHNDLEEVGVDTYHHTMFEMLGNWSFGDYFKQEALTWSWELLTEVYKIPKDRLYASVFAGDEKENLPASTVALRIWKTLVPEDHIVFGNKKDNFWEMGETGPCGPCSEIHVDCRPDEERKKTPGHLLVNKDHPQVIEIWNNVFMQYNRLKDGSLQPLSSTHVDTGMGLERLVRVIQGKESNYDTDIFSGTIQETEKLSGKKYTAGDSKQDIAFRVLADHIRAIAFTISDGQLPSNTGAGYVIRRILRRAVRYYYSYLDVKEPIIYQLLPGLANQFKDVFPELHAQLNFVSKVVKEEEESFLRTLGKGLKKIDDIILASKSSGVIAGAAAFELYDTYGFPIDLTKLISSENGIKVDEEGFEREMQTQKNRSRAATASDVDDWIEVEKKGESKDSDLNDIKSVGSSMFIGYDKLESDSTLLRYRKVTSKSEVMYQLVLDKTPFYAESGGQVGDIGIITIGGVDVNVVSTKKENDLIVHTVFTMPEKITSNVIARVDVERRKQITLHHTCTHLLHAALRTVLGEHVAQKGSLVNENGLRFDFSHFAKMTEEELEKVSDLINRKIRENIPLVIREMHKDDAIKLGAMALFGEKYGEMVRVVIIDPSYSIELCGGTHVASTAELGHCIITAESSVASGVRRIEALCGYAADKKNASDKNLLKQVHEILKNPRDIIKAIEHTVEENSILRKKLEQTEHKLSIYLQKELVAGAEQIKGINFIGEVVNLSSSDLLKKTCNELRNSFANTIVVLGANIDGKASIALGLSDKLSVDMELDAVAMIKTHVASIIKGGGGGQKILATAGGQLPEGLKDAIQAIKKSIS